MIKRINPCNHSAPVAFGCPYEEWKHNDVNQFAGTDLLLDVPMRNGNEKVLTPTEFVILLLDVPMRNGNSISLRRSTSLCMLLDVPMRNGNVHGQRAALCTRGFWMSL
ncbi:hypothetical protein Dpep_0483 [Dethiosulfovibrio peptidovorans DSM 11002]|uniref:Uncharacterized protein n=1 Tax=Dethiosulfovibrio peptidovorans DSM 11002 TaxID=469381 RepID=D2Z4I4_9BACT|nr:hypothetical protein Dpep_0483 [Dethiosulfovibrio peptidovorans DSM 11002]